MRVAIYARFSTDKQSEASTADQIRVATEYAKQHGWSIVAAHEDKAMSGAVADRPGYQALLRDVRAGRIDLVLVEEVSRLWRAQAEQWRCVEEFEYLGVRIVGIRDGVDTGREGSELLLAMQGGMNALARKETAWRTRRGLSGKIEKGLCAGGVPYGYRTVKVDGGRALEIVEEQARVVVEIFEAFRNGSGCRAIAHDLNRRGVPSPRGKAWALSAIYGHQGKGTGILNQDLYRGLLIWNRSRWQRVPGSKKRRRIERPESEWVRQEVPELQIVSDELWEAVKRRQHSSRLTGGTKGKGARPRTLLGGLMHCDTCGAPYVAVNQWAYGCSQHHNRGETACPNAREVSRKGAERKILEFVKDATRPDHVDRLQQYVREAVATMRQDRDQEADRTRQRLATLDRDIDNLTAAVAEMGLSDALRRRLADAESERRRLADALRDAPCPSEVLPRLADRCRQALLQGEIAKDPQAAREALAALLGRVTIVRKGRAVWARIPGIYESAAKLVDGSGSGGRI